MGESDMKNYRTELSQRVRYAIIAGMAGAFLIPQVGFAAPAGEHDYTAGVNVDRATANTTKITATATNNVINWRDYSVNHGELVQYDGGNKTNNYLNIVTGANTSNINGKIEGGNNVYIVNPNGVIFGKNAEVNVGHLHVSTQDTSTVNTAADMANNVSPLSASAAGLSDVVNMGKDITANTVEVHGKNIRFLNAANVHTTASPVVLHTDTANGGYAHIGYKSGSMPTTTDYQVNGAAATAADNYYQLVADKTEFQNINSDRTKNYMLEDNIDFAGNALTPIAGTGTDFTGKFDGNFFKLQNFTITGGTYTAPFGRVSNSRIENLGVTGATITGDKTGNQDRWAGGIIGHATGTTIKNVYVTDTTVDGEAGQHGGIVGQTVGTTLDSVYSKAKIGEGGAVIGTSSAGTVISDTYSNSTKIVGTTGTELIYFIDPSNGTTVKNTYVIGPRLATNESGLSAAIAMNTYIVNKTTGKASKFKAAASTGKSMTAAGTYAGFDINNDGTPGAKWRIYEGRTTPMLTAFMNGTATATYNYRYFNNDAGHTPADTSATAVKSNNGADVTGLKYNSKYVKIVGTPNTTVGGKTNVVYEGYVDQSKVHDYVTGGTQDFDKTNGIRNVGTKAILWSDQDGPNLRGVNVTIDPREVKLTGGDLNVTRMYNGKKSVKDAFVTALTSGSVGTAGFISGDDVTLDTTTFTADMTDKNVVRNTDGTYGKKNVTFGGTINLSGDDAKNYTFDNASISTLTGTVTITPAPLYLNIAKPKAADKTYDGTNEVKDDDMKQSGSTKNIKLDKSKIAPMTPPGGTIPDGAIMRDDSNNVDNVELDAVNDPTYTNIHAGSRKLRYTGVALRTGAGYEDGKNYDLYYTLGGTKTQVTDSNVDLDGDIVARQITRDSFKVYNKSGNTPADAQKVYDGNDEYTPGSNVYLSTNAAANGNTGVVERDQGHITFKLIGDKGYFTDNGGNRTKNVKEATKLAYQVTGQADSHTDTYGGHLLSDYYVLDTDNTTKKSLSSEFSATGAGKITPKTITATVKKKITKVYDALPTHTETGDDIITLAGIIAGDAVTNNSTVVYADKNVARDAGGNVIDKNVTYTATFSITNPAEAQNYTFAPQPATTPVTTSTTLSGLGRITPRPITMTFGSATKVYDGEVTNNSKTLTAVDDGTGGVVLGRDGIAPMGSLPPTIANGIKSRYGDGTTEGSFRENRNAGSRSVEYANLQNAFAAMFGNNYAVADKQYGTGTITRRRIDKSGFRVYNADGSVADATKVYDGNDRYTLASGAYLTGTPASGDTGVVSRDYGKVTFALKTGSTGHFASDADGNNRTSHVSEAHHVAYDVVARSSDLTNHPLTNYTFGSAAEETAGTLRNLETVNDTNPAHVTAAGSITPASIRATTKEISKVYDGMREHTDGNRTEVKGDTVVSFTGWVSGQTRDNTSTALYATKDVARDSNGNVIKKNVTYKAQLTGQYADDYQIVDAGNNVISGTPSGSGAAKTVTANLGTVANAGTITPRKLNIKMGDVSKTYDGTAGNTSATVTGFTDDPASSVLAAVLGVDNVTATRLTNRYQGMMTASPATATSTYGRGTTSFTANANASNGTQHDVQYTNMRTAFNNEFGVNAGNYTVDETVYGKGTINRRDISPNNFQVRDANGNIANATKVYDGTSSYTLKTGDHLTPNSGPSTGIIATDQNDVFFRLSGDGAQFADSSDNPTANVATATKVLYNVKAEGDAEKIKNYTLNGVNLESGTGKVSGGGSITRRVLELDLVQKTGIDKVYDRETTLKNTATKNWNALRDSDSTGNVRYATGATAKDKLVTTDGTSFNITSDYMESGSADKNVKRSGGNIVDKDILYKVAINGNATNYSFKKGGTVTNAESGLELSATGKITPKDLSGALKKVTKVYDGTKNVDPLAVGLESGLNGVVSGDTVTLGSHTESFQSENVNGDGTTETIGGTVQKNWVNYSNLTLGGTDAGNYTLASTAKGLGEITPYQLNDSSISFTKTRATKVYDGTRDVKWTDGSSTTTDQKKYITSATVTVGSAPAVDILGDLKLEEAKYDTKDVDGGNATDRVTYKLSYTGTNGNFSLGTGVTSFTTKGDGVITKKDVTATVRNPLSKTYDATTVVKNAAGNVITGSALNDQVSLSGLTGNDGATYTTTAQYADKNAGTGNKTVNYTLNIDAANAGNYNLKYKTGSGNAFSTNDNTITKRNVDVNFDHVSKDYDSKATNTKIAPKVSAADATVLGQDSAGNVSGTNITNLTGVTSQYGTLSGGTFQPNANAGDKTVRYQGVGTAMGTVFGTNNYDFNVKDGTGRINRAKINAGNVVFDADDARKTYDGTTTVKYGGSSANSEVRKYINRIGVTLNGNWVDLQNDVTMDSAEYSDANATNGTKHRVTYKFHLDNSNIDISGDNTFSKDKEGIIDRRVLNLDLAEKSGIDKIYDATPDVHNTDTRHYNAFVDHDAKGNVVYAAGTMPENKLVRKADGTPDATVNVEAAYADKNVARVGGVVSNRDINYTVKIDAAHGGRNYQLSDGTNPAVDAEVGLTTLKAEGKITPRTLTLGFKNVEKQYDTTAKNNDMTITSARGGNSDGRGVDTLKQDDILAADGTVNTGAFDTTNVASEYGTRSNDPANPFTPDPNVGTKDVRYTNVKSALSGAKAGNYEIVDTVYGTGEITRAKIKAADFDFQIDPSKKTYDGTTNVYWKDKEGRWQEAKGEEGLDGAKKYYFGDRSTVKLANGQRVKVNPADFSLTEAAYQNKNVAGGTETWTDADGNTHRNWVNYKLHINTTNFDVEGERDTTRKGVGTISKRDLATMLPKHLIKEYDGQQTFDETNRDYVNALANENITHIVKEDQGKIQLKVEGKYSDKDASAETKADAQNGVHLSTAPNGRTVDYKLTLSGDADTLANYTLAGHDTTHTVTGKAADIYKKTLTVTVKNIDKVYDGTSTVVRDAGGGILVPHPEAGKLKFDPDDFVRGEEFSFDQTAADKIDGLYSDPNVSRAADGTFLDKDIAYSGVKAAFKNYADNHAGSAARNYRVDSDTVSGKGKIMPRTITADQLTDKLKFDTATKTYDGTTTVKHSAGALEKYISSAKVDIGGREIDIKKDLKIRSDKDWTHYDTEHVDGGRKTNRVTYTLDYTGNNFDITGTITKQADGVITKRKVTAYAPGRLTKMYDGTDKVLDADKSIKTYYRGKLVEKPDHIVQMEKAEESLDGDTGLLSTDGAKNESTAKFDDKNVGTNKTVTYDVKIDAAHNGDYEIVDVHGNAVTQLKTKNNEITKRKLNLTFDHVDKFYDASAENPDVTARVLDSDTRKTLQRDHAGFNGTQLVFEDSASNPLATPSYYGTGTTDSSFTQDANAGDKSVQYEVGDALRSLLGDDAKNYEFADKGYGTGEIKKANVSEDDFRDLKFKNVDKEYDGNANVNRPLENLRDDSRWKSNKMLKSDIASIKGTYLGSDGKPDKNASEHNKDVAYQIQLSDRNFKFGNWNGQVTVKGAGRISRRELTADYLPKQTKVYDGTKNIASVGDSLVTFRHKSGERPFIKNDDVRNSSTATYDDANVAWKNDLWKQGSGQESDKDVNYDLKLSGEDAANYKIVDESGTEIHTLKAKNNGKIMAKEIHLKSDPQTRWINEGMPESYEGKPMGSNLGQSDVPELLPGEVLPGEIYYESPNGRLRWGDYRIDGYYRAPKAGTRYQLPDGSWTTQSFAGGDGDAVSRNYRFVQDPANATALHIGPYVPDTDYYKALTQTSKMLPDEYAYENASLDRRSHFGRDPEAEISYESPSLNMVKDGVDISKNGIEITDETVFRLVNEVFG